MKKLFFFILFFILVSFSKSFAVEVDSSLWQTKKSQHFIIYYQEAPVAFVDELIYKSENYYNSIVDELGYRRLDFWSWDNRAKIYLYKNAEDFQTNTQRSAWTGAIVSVRNRVMKTFVGQDHFFDSLLPHEMTHIIFREFIGVNTPLPLWIDEGVASSQEKSNLSARMQMAKNLVAKNQYIKLDNLSKTNNFEKDTVAPDIFYSEAASLIVFLIHQEGKDRFLEFSRSLRDGINWRSALLKVYNFTTLEEMEQEWKDFMLGYK
ncbi:MAG: hypothetical protein L6308_02955 [Candidatus Omnitrophica bacterium]|nr:hypothetical protein [Candidatus Omnitrophota bacterium]